MHAREFHKSAMTAQFIDHLSPVGGPEMLVILMRVYNLVLGVPWFKTQKPEIDWATV